MIYSTSRSAQLLVCRNPSLRSPSSLRWSTSILTLKLGLQKGKMITYLSLERFTKQSNYQGPYKAPLRINKCFSVYTDSRDKVKCKSRDCIDLRSIYHFKHFVWWNSRSKNPVFSLEQLNFKLPATVSVVRVDKSLLLFYLNNGTYNRSFQVFQACFSNEKLLQKYISQEEIESIKNFIAPMCYVRPVPKRPRNQLFFSL